jgi:sec-independent protein translocase protein TatC
MSVVKVPSVFRRKTPEQRTGQMSVVEHLEELRHRIVVCLIAVGIGGIAAWFLYDPFMELIKGPYCDYLVSNPDLRPTAVSAGGDCPLYFFGTIDAFLLKMKVVLFLGLALAMPVILWQLWSFVVPGLTQRERRWAIPFIVSSTLLFALGVAFAMWTLPKALDFLLGFAGSVAVPLLTADRYVGFVTLVALAFGLSFLFPVFLVALEGAGVLSTKTLRSWRRWAILAITVFAAVITPSSDPFSMLAMMIPMYLFYEAAIIIGRMMKR